jgi:hypothetical protein
MDFKVKEELNKEEIEGCSYTNEYVRFHFKNKYDLLTALNNIN